MTFPVLTLMLWLQSSILIPGEVLQTHNESEDHTGMWTSFPMNTMISSSLWGLILMPQA